MRKIPINKWKAKMPDGSEVEESLLSVLNALISAKKPEEMPRGLDNFRLMHRLANAFEKAESMDFLELEETEYLFLMKSIEKDVPSLWGANKNISEAIYNFLEAKAIS